MPARARSEKRVVTPATKMAHHMATRQAFLASSTLLTSGQNQDELFMEDSFRTKVAKARRGDHRTRGQVSASTQLDDSKRRYFEADERRTRRFGRRARCANDLLHDWTSLGAI